MDNRFYLQALGITGLFIGVMILFWIASGGPANEAAVNNANGTRTAIAMTGSYLLQPRTRTPDPSVLTAPSVEQTSLPNSTPTTAALPSITNTALFPQFNTPLPTFGASVTALASQTPVAPAVTALPTQTFAVPSLVALPSQTLPAIPIFTTTALPRRANTKVARVPFPTVPQPQPAATQAIVTPAAGQGPADFVRWYFTRVWNERDYQNLWDNYLSLSYKANVGSGLFEDYVGWWDSVQRVDVKAADVLANNGTDAIVRVNLTFHMKDGRVVENQVYDYDFLFDPARRTWMFDSSP